MKPSTLTHRVICTVVGVVLLAGCSAAESSISSDGATARTQHLSPEMQKLIAMTRADHKVPVQLVTRIRSWMVHVPASAPLLYVSDDGYYPAVVDVFNYTTGSMVGQVTDSSFEYLSSPCSDSKGNVYVPDFKSGAVYEIAHRTTNVIKSWSNNGNPIGCSVSSTGNLAVTAFHYGGVYSDGGVIIYPGAGNSGTLYQGPGDDFPATYDKAGNLFLEADYADQCTSPCLAELPNGSSSWIILSYKQHIYFPSSVELMGTTLGVGDQQEGGGSESAIYATTVSGNSAKNKHTTTLTDSNCGSGNDLVSWANVSAKPDGLQLKTVTGAAGANVLCETLDEWKFPAGGNQIGTIGGASAPHGATLIK